MNNEEILKLAKECGFQVVEAAPTYTVLPIASAEHLEAFYRAAFNQGLEAAAKEVEKGIFGHFECGASIRSLKEMK